MFFSIIPTRVHGCIDYIFGALLIASPWLFGFGNSTNWGMAIPVVLGTTVIVYSIFTCYEWGALHLIPMPAHLTIDLLLGIALAVSPWLIGFANIIWWPQLTFGLLAILLALITSRVPGPDTRSRTDNPGNPAAV
jgi:hypothetical protein